MKKNRLLFKMLTLTLLTCVFIFPNLSAQEENEEKNFETKHPVSNGTIEIENIEYPVFKDVLNVTLGRFGGIKYVIPIKNLSIGKRLAPKVINFYIKKSINNVSVGKFTKISKPDSIAWSSSKCAEAGEGGILILVMVADEAVTVYAIPSCDEGILAMIV